MPHQPISHPADPEAFAFLLFLPCRIHVTKGGCRFYLLCCCATIHNKTDQCLKQFLWLFALFIFDFVEGCSFSKIFFWLNIVPDLEIFQVLTGKVGSDDSKLRAPIAYLRMFYMEFFLITFLIISQNRSVAPECCS